MSNMFEEDFESADFQDIIDLMYRARWIKSAGEDTYGVTVEWSELGKIKALEMARLVRPFTAWLRDRSGPKPDREDQLICANSLAPYRRELGWVTDSEAESIKLVAFIALLAPE